MKTLNLILLALTFTLVLSSNSFAEKWERLLNLRGTWKFSIGDDKKWSQQKYDDSNWDEIRVPSLWEDQGFYGYDGFAWYRKTFNVPSAVLKQNMYLALGYIDDVDEVYLNGTRIGLSGTFPPEYETAYNAFRRYPIPSGLLKLNNNVISVRVYDAEMGGGITSGDVGLYTLQGAMQVDINLEGEWKFKTGNDDKWKAKDFNDNSWGSVLVPALWETQGYQDYDGFAWYRKEVHIPENLRNKKLVLVMGKIDDIDEVYINGKLIGSTGNMKEIEGEVRGSADIHPGLVNHGDEYSRFRGYYLPENAFNINAKNVIAVKVFDGYIGGGIYQGPIGIITQDKYRKYWHAQKKSSKNMWDLFFGE